MAKKKSKKPSRRENKEPSANPDQKPKSGKSAALRKRKSPNWPVLALATVGALLTAYLSYTTFTRTETLFCGAGSACDLVQESRWSMLLGVPIAFWGFLSYCALGWVAYRVRHAGWHWKLLFTFSLIGVSVSVYLTIISLAVIEATCFYCLISLAIMTAILAVTLWQKPKGLPNFSWPGWLAQTGAFAVIVVLLLHLYHSGWLAPGTGPEDPYLRALTIHLVDSGAKFYGAYWCPNCEQQKAMFESSAHRLPYIECSPSGRAGPRAPECIQNEISNYPTWIINGQRRVGQLQISQIARLTNFLGVPGAAAK